MPHYELSAVYRLPSSQWIMCASVCLYLIIHIPPLYAIKGFACWPYNEASCDTRIKTLRHCLELVGDGIRLQTPHVGAAS